MKNICFIVGQHRSGTSALTGLLKIYGANRGKGYTHEEDQWNSKGYFENKTIEAFNESVFARLGTYWSCVTDTCDFRYNPADLGWVRDRDELVGILSGELAVVPQDGLLVIKDPRISLLVSLYEEALSEIPYVEPSFLFAQRSISENIASLVRRGALSTTGPDGTRTMTPDWAKRILDKHSKVFHENFSYRYPMEHHTFSNLFYKLPTYIAQLNTAMGWKLNLCKEANMLAEGFLDGSLKHESAKKTAKVIATYFGNRRRWPSGIEETKQLWKQILKLEKKINPGDAVDTIVVLHEHGVTSPIDYIQSLDGMPTRFGLIKVLRRPWEDGVGASFKSFDYAFSVLGNQYDQWVFDEDDVLLVDDGYLTSAVKQFYKHNDVAFLGMMRCDARQPVVSNGQVQGGRLFSASERKNFPSIWHAHGGCGFTTTHYLNQVKTKFGSLPYSKMSKPGKPGSGLHEEHPWYRNFEQQGEVMFTAAYHLLGYRVMEIDHERPITYSKHDDNFA